MPPRFLKSLFAIVVLGSLCAGCAAGNSPKPARVGAAEMVGPIAVEIEPVDSSCSYFYYLWGKSAEYSHRFDEALEAFDKALLCDEQTGYLQRERAILLIKMNKKAEAVQQLEQISSQNPDDTNLLVLLAKLYTSMGKNSEGIAAYKRLLEIKEDEDVLLLLGTLYAQDGRYEEAEKELLRLTSLNSESFMGYYYLAKLYQELRYFDKAFAAFERALAINWSVRLAFEVADLYVQQNRQADAIVLYQRAVIEDEASEAARTKLINLYLGLGETEKALNELKELRRYADDAIRVDYTISRVLLGLEKYDEAIALLSAILAEDPGDNASRFLLALVQFQKGNLADAKTLLQAMPPAAKEYNDGIQLLVRILRDQDDLAGAVILLEQLLADESLRQVRLYLMLASIYREQDNIPRAIEVLEHGVSAFPDDAELLYGYGLLLERIGDHDGALAKMEAVLEIDSKHAAALNYIGYSWADKGVNLDRALEYIQQAVDQRPDDAFIRDSLGWVYYRLGDLDRALVELRQAVALEASDAVILEHLGDVSLAAAQYDEARAAYDKAIELYEEEEKKAAVREKLENIPTTK